MGIYEIGGEIVFGVALPIARFPALATEHARRFDTTGTVESLGEQLRRNDFPDAEIEIFITSVCAWGGYAGIGRRILNGNSLPAIRAALREANGFLDAPQPEVGGALARLNGLHSLGSPSFASKHLRFLRPDICPVMDSVLRDALPYSFDRDGYADFARDCGSLAGLLKRQGAINPWRRADGVWFTADVEAALYVHFSGWA
jgi:hypothetical protein